MIEIWNKWKKPVCQTKVIKSIIISLYNDYTKVKKNLNRRNVPQTKKEYAFRTRLTELFDITLPNILISPPAQRSGIFKEYNKKFQLKNYILLHCRYS